MRDVPFFRWLPVVLVMGPLKFLKVNQTSKNMNRIREGTQVFHYRHIRRRSIPASSHPLPFEYVLFSKKQSSTTCIACPEIDRR